MIVFGDQISRRPQPVAIERRADPFSIRERDRGGTIPWLHQRRVIFVERALFSEHRRIGVPRFRNQHGDHMRQAAAGERQHLDRVVERAVSLPPGWITGKILLISSPNTSEASTDSRAFIQFTLPRTVLISPLWHRNRYGCASCQLGNVLVEKRWWTRHSALARRGVRQLAGKNRRSAAPAAGLYRRWSATTSTGCRKIPFANVDWRPLRLRRGGGPRRAFAPARPATFRYRGPGKPARYKVAWRAPAGRSRRHSPACRAIRARSNPASRAIRSTMPSHSRRCCAIDRQKHHADAVAAGVPEAKIPDLARTRARKIRAESGSECPRRRRFRDRSRTRRDASD